MRACIAIICARGGSCRVPRKNTAILNGRPLLDYTIAAARESGLFTDIVVNSDDDEILDIGRRCGASTYKRPLEYGPGTVFIIDVVREWLKTTDVSPETAIAVLFPTVPLRTSDDLIQSHATFAAAKYMAPVVSVTPYEYPVQVALRCNADGRLEPLLRDEYKKTTRHDEHGVSYRANYAVVWNTAEVLLQQRNLIGENPIPFHMPLERSIDIDDDYQMLLCRLLLEHRDGVHHE